MNQDPTDFWGNASVQASDGGYYMIGATNSFNNAGNDVFLIAPQLNAKQDIIQQHVRSDGSIRWAGVRRP